MSRKRSDFPDDTMATSPSAIYKEIIGNNMGSLLFNIYISDRDMFIIVTGE